MTTAEETSAIQVMDRFFQELSGPAILATGAEAGSDSETELGNPAALSMMAVGLMAFHPKTQMNRQKQEDCNRLVAMK
jgi:hypothetical protein